MDSLFTDAVRDMLHDHCTPELVREVEAGGTADTLWKLLESAGFADALVPESAGGAGLSWAEAAPVLELFGRHALPLPLGETMLVRSLVAAASVTVPPGLTTLACAAPADDETVSCPHVPCGRLAATVLVAFDGEARLLPTAGARRAVFGFKLDAAMVWPLQAWHDAAPTRLRPPLSLRTLQAAIYSVQLAGAMAAVLERSLEYANDRQQFGKPIGKFQAIQHQLSLMSEHVFASRMAAQLCMPAEGAVFDELRVAMAKARASEAAVEVAALSHSIHGAIGFTAEYPLQLLTRRLHAWRQTAGSESAWHDVIGRALLTKTDAPSLDLLRRLTDMA